MSFTYRVGEDTTYDSFGEFLREHLELTGLEGEIPYKSVTIEVVRPGPKATSKDYPLNDCYDNIGEAVRQDLKELETGMLIRVIPIRGEIEANE